MTLAEMLTAALTDPFRIGLIVALVLTTVRTQGVTGTLLPLAAGLLFVAVIIPSTMGLPADVPLWQVAGVGLVANVLILVPVWALWHLYRSRMR